jgi:hypothetical protein
MSLSNVSKCQYLNAAAVVSRGKGRYFMFNRTLSIFKMNYLLHPSNILLLLLLLRDLNI